MNNLCEQLRWKVAHDPCRTGDRTPAGAVPAGQSVQLLLRVDRSEPAPIEAAYLLIRELSLDEERAKWHKLPLQPHSQGFQATIETAGEPRVLMYAFELELPAGKRLYYIPRADGRSTAGELAECGGDDSLQLPHPPSAFQLTIYEPAFATPDRFAGAIMYQIFPDRFARGSHGIRRDGIAYHARMNRPVHLHEDWDEAPEWQDVSPDQPYDPIDFFGGTLDGIREKLPYLASLGVQVIYLNPIFEARSNHRYDTADYGQIDPLLGDEQAFRLLAEEAREQGIELVLDAVLSHTGNDSRYFNAKNTYPEPGAAQGPHSPYYDWYEFFGPLPDATDDANDNEEESGNATDSATASPDSAPAATTPLRPPYRCWWGDPTLPEVDERSATWQEHMLSEQGILAKWLDRGAGGYRLDVADEIPDDVLERIRTRVKASNPNALIIGEVWEDPTTKASYGTQRTYALGRSLDTVMNYPLREALLGFVLGSSDAFQLATFLKLQQANYPRPLYRCLMNLLSSHDIERVRSVLALGGQFKHLPRSEQKAAVESITSQQNAVARTLHLLLAGLLYALPGMPCLYYGDEVGMHGGGDPFCRAAFPWQKMDDLKADELVKPLRELGRLRMSSRALREGNLACTAFGSDAICIVRTLPDNPEIALVFASRSHEEKQVAVDLRAPELGIHRIGSMPGGHLPGEHLPGEDGIYRTTLEYGLNYLVFRPGSEVESCAYTLT